MAAIDETKLFGNYKKYFPGCLTTMFKRKKYY
jgi:hypothetical protein